MSELHLPSGYIENPPASEDSFGDYWSEDEVRTADQWQAPVYRFAAQRVAGKVVVDVGCGTGGKLAKYVAPAAARCVGIDQSSGIDVARRNHPGREWHVGHLGDPQTWELARSIGPELVICSDVIEHVPDPRQLLRDLKGVGGTLLISTPDRELMADTNRDGPPASPLHIREWTATEFRRLLEDEGLEILEHEHLPPRADIPKVLAAKMLIWRVLHRRGVRLPRSSMVFVCSTTGGRDSEPWAGGST